MAAISQPYKMLHIFMKYSEGLEQRQIQYL